MTKRHHAAHPPSSVSPNLAVNKKPNAASAPEISARPAAAKALARDCEDPNPDPDLSPGDLDLD